MKIINKRAHFDYQLFNKFEAGIHLLGSEVKAIKARRVDLSQSFAKFFNGELFLINANMNPDSPPQDYNPARSRKLLMHRAELLSIQTKLKKQKLTLVPLALYNKGRIFKLELALGKTRRKFEKRAKIKEKDIQRELEHESVEKEW